MKPAKLIRLLYIQVLIGLLLGVTVGHYWPEFGAALKPLGDGFVKLVKMMIAPIVFCTIVSGITSLGESKEIGKTLLKSMGLFYVLTILALLTGLAAAMSVSTCFTPGVRPSADQVTSTVIRFRSSGCVTADPSVWLSEQNNVLSLCTPYPFLGSSIAHSLTVTVYVIAC